MSKRQRSKNSGSPERLREPAPNCPTAPRPRPTVRPSLLVGGLLVVIAAAGWWSFHMLRGDAARDAIAALEPVASQAGADQPERREALAVADRLLRDYPDSAEALYARGVLLFRYGLSDEAVKTWKACIALVPDLAPAYEFLGIAACQRGDSEQAVEHLRKAIQLDPQSPAAGLYLGEALNCLGKMDEAVPVLEQFIKVAPRSPEPYFQLGQAYLYLKAYDRAKECYQAALQQDPGFAQAFYGLATAYERLGQAGQANEYRQKYLAMVAQSRAEEQRRVRQNRDQGEVRRSLAEAYTTASKVYQAHGRTQEAREYMAKASAVSSGSAPAAALGVGDAHPNRLSSKSGR